MRMSKAPKKDRETLRIWMQFNDELCKIDPTIKREWDDFKSDWKEEEDWEMIIEHCEDEYGFNWEYYMDYYSSRISHIHMRIIFGYEVLVDNVCNPELDYLDYKKEIKDLMECSEATSPNK